jgi:hypothetical protein
LTTPNAALADELERLIEASQRATGNLEQPEWRPSRAHFEGLRNTVNGAIRFLTALRQPSSVSDEMVEAAKRLSTRAAMYAATRPGQQDLRTVLASLAALPLDEVSDETSRS